MKTLEFSLHEIRETLGCLFQKVIELQPESEPACFRETGKLHSESVPMAT